MSTPFFCCRIIPGTLSVIVRKKRSARHKKEQNKPVFNDKNSTEPFYRSVLNSFCSDVYPSNVSVMSITVKPIRSA